MCLLHMFLSLSFSPLSPLSLKKKKKVKSLKISIGRAPKAEWPWDVIRFCKVTWGSAFLSPWEFYLWDDFDSRALGANEAHANPPPHHLCVSLLHFWSLCAGVIWSNKGRGGGKGGPPVGSARKGKDNVSVCPLNYPCVCVHSSRASPS